MTGLLTITTPAPSTRLTLAASARDDLGLTDSSMDTVINGLIDRASGVISGFCGRPFGTEGLTEIFRFAWGAGQGPSTQAVAPYGTPLNSQRKPLILARSQVQAVTSVTENGTLLTAATDYECDPASGLLYRMRNGYRSWWSTPAVTVVYTAGFVLPGDTGTRTLPYDVEECCLALVRLGYFARGRDPHTITDMLNGDRTQFRDRSTSVMAIDDDMENKLADYQARS